MAEQIDSIDLERLALKSAVEDFDDALIDFDRTIKGKKLLVCSILLPLMAIMLSTAASDRSGELASGVSELSEVSDLESFRIESVRLLSSELRNLIHTNREFYLNYEIINNLRHLEALLSQMYKEDDSLNMSVIHQMISVQRSLKSMLSERVELGNNFAMIIMVLGALLSIVSVGAKARLVKRVEKRLRETMAELDLWDQGNVIRESNSILNKYGYRIGLDRNTGKYILIPPFIES